jgi:hypothetical protein
MLYSKIEGSGKPLLILHGFWNVRQIGILIGTKLAV